MIEVENHVDIIDWGTLNTASSPTKLPLGQTPNCQNIWVDEKPGSVITAQGFRKVGSIPSGNPVTFCIDFFKASAGTQTFVVSDNSTVWTTVDFQTFTSIITGLSSSFQLRGMVIRDKLWLTNGSDSVRTYNGTTVVVLDGTGGTPTVPKGRFISYHDERVWLFHIPSNRSQIAFSALTNSSGDDIDPDNASAWPSDNTLQISQGDADYGTGLIVYRGYLYMFKQYTIWRLIGYDEYTYSRVKCRASTGTGFNESLQIVDNFVHMIGIDGIYVFDGDDADRISDIIDPATATQAAFGFNQLQQPNAKKQFWEVASTSDWNAGTVIPTNATVDDSYANKATDDSQADFVAGVLKTNIDTSETPASIQLTHKSTGVSSHNIALGASGSLQPLSNTGVFGVASYMTDGNTSNYCGFTGSHSAATASFNLGTWAFIPITRVILKGCIASFAQMIIRVAGNQIHISSVSGGGVVLTSDKLYWPAGPGPSDITIDFDGVSSADIQLQLTLLPANTGFTVTEIQVFSAAYQASGKFISQTLDYTNIPTSYGIFNADITLNGETATYFTQSSSDGSAWDAEVACTNGGAIGSTLRRYLRWGVNFTSDGLDTPVLSDAFLMSKYESAVHSTGGSIFAWGPIESDYNLAGQTIKFYYRGDATAAGVLAKSWNVIVPGGVLGLSTADVYAQFKFEIWGGTATTIPKVTSVTINWVQGTGVEPQTLQNVASFFWRNRYWMSAASTSSAYNDTILIRGKKTFKSPWMLKDWTILSFCRFQDNLYGGSSVDGSIYQLDSGYSKDGEALDSFFETGDLTMQGTHFHCNQVVLEVEKSGTYNLVFGISINRGVTWKEYNVDLTPTEGEIPSFWEVLNVSSGTTPIIRFRVRTNGIDEPFEVHNLRAFLQPSAARGSIPLRSY